MNVILASVRWQFVLLSLDDIFVFSQSQADHFEQVRLVRLLLYKAGVTLKLKKCKLFADTIDYLDHVIPPGHLELVELTTQTAVELEHPTTQTEIWVFMGLCNIFRWFAPSFAHLAGPLARK